MGLFQKVRTPLVKRRLRPEKSDLDGWDRLNWTSGLASADFRWQGSCPELFSSGSPAVFAAHDDVGRLIGVLAGDIFVLTTDPLLPER
jgi:hypothetical protein